MMGIPYTFLWKLSGILTTLSRFWNALIMVVLPLPHRPHSITPHLLPEVRLAARLLTCASTAPGQRNVPPKRHTSPSTALSSSFAAVSSSKGSLKRSFVVLGRDSRDISISISWGFPYCSMSACIQSFGRNGSGSRFRPAARFLQSSVRRKNPGYTRTVGLY